MITLIEFWELPENCLHCVFSKHKSELRGGANHISLTSSDTLPGVALDLLFIQNNIS